MACPILYGGHNDCETANASLLNALRSMLVKSCHGGAGRWASDGIMEHPTLLILYYTTGGQYETRPCGKYAGYAYGTALTLYFVHLTRSKIQGLVSRDTIVDRQFVTAWVRESVTNIRFMRRAVPSTVAYVAENCGDFLYGAYRSGESL